MDAEEFREALETLGWTQTRAARELGVSSPARINDWCHGRRIIPEYISSSVQAQLELHDLKESGRWVRLNYLPGDETPENGGTSTSRDPSEGR